MDKKTLRKIMIEKRDMLSEEKEIFDNKIKNKLLNIELYKKSKNIFVYIGFGSEINTKEIINCFFYDNKNVYVPKTNIETKEMNAVKINSFENLVENRYGILEPNNDEIILNKDNIDLIILPGVAFDYNGGRVGYGGGYYDRYLESINKDISKVALIYDFQLLDKVPCEDHDIRADYIITEKRFIECN